MRCVLHVFVFLLFVVQAAAPLAWDLTRNDTNSFQIPVCSADGIHYVTDNDADPTNLHIGVEFVAQATGWHSAPDMAYVPTQAMEFSVAELAYYTFQSTALSVQKPPSQAPPLMIVS